MDLEATALPIATQPLPNIGNFAVSRNDAKNFIYNCRAFIRLSAELIGGIPFKFIIYFSAWFRSIRSLTMSKRKKERGPLGTSKNEEKRTFCVELRTS